MCVFRLSVLVGLWFNPTSVEEVFSLRRKRGSYGRRGMKDGVLEAP